VTIHCRHRSRPHTRIRATLAAAILAATLAVGHWHGTGIGAADQIAQCEVTR
jgi:hypothetical protein